MVVGSVDLNGLERLTDDCALDCTSCGEAHVAFAKVLTADQRKREIVFEVRRYGLYQIFPRGVIALPMIEIHVKRCPRATAHTGIERESTLERPAVCGNAHEAGQQPLKGRLTANVVGGYSLTSAYFLGS